MRGDWDSDCLRKSLWKAVLRSCKHSLSLSAKAQIWRYIFLKQCCAVAWRLEFRLLQKEFVKSSVAQLRSLPQLFCYGSKSDIFFFQAVLRCCMEIRIQTASEKVFGKQCCAVATTFSAFLLRLKFGQIFFLSSVALLHRE